MHVPTRSFENMFIDRVSDEGKGYHESLTKDEKNFYEKLSKLKFKNPKVIARSFKEFSERIVPVDYSYENGKCCLRGHASDKIEYNISDILRRRDC